MSTLSVPISPNLEVFISNMINQGLASSKAEVVRQALAHYAEDQAIEVVLHSEQEARDGEILQGNLRQLI